ncbi:MAG: prepilin-type N-terminal cleavage/methylation domain-containing protein, partial [Verrucomicrobiae bacterium]|nr:prepilin-type N-terminal cleavage/methylation domain-containing protein [Verrucomicrobiae bacterium]
SSLRPRSGFSLLELLLAVSIMGVIIASLYGMFYQVQRGLRANVTQVDVLEGSRATLDLLTRDMTDMAATDRLLGTNLAGHVAYWPPVVQNLMEGQRRTNLLHELTFLTRYNQEFSATGYRVLFAGNGVGTLSRYSTNALPWAVDPTNLVHSVLQQRPERFVPVLGGVIQFRVVPYDALGWPMIYRPTNLYDPEVLLSPDQGGETRYAFTSNALPAYVEVELGVLEPQTLAQYEGFAAGSTRALEFLADHAGQVQLFRQRIPIRLGAATRPFFAQP